MKKKILNKPNELISLLPRESISVIQQKSYNVFLVEAQTQVKFSNKTKYTDINKGNKYLFNITFKELVDMAGIDKKDYEYIKEELQKLMKIVVEVVDKENKNNWSLFHLLECVEKEENIFEYSLNWRIVQALKNCDFFTKLDLQQLSKLKCKYSVILYELAIRYEKFKIPKMTIETFRKRTNTEDTYNRMYDLKKHVLDKACKEITKKTDIKLSYDTEKQGRKIAYIDFHIDNNPQVQPTKQVQKLEETEAQIRKNEDYSNEVLFLFEQLPKDEQIEVNKSILSKLLRKHNFEYIKEDIKYAKKQKPKNFMSYLMSSCNLGHYSRTELEKQKVREETEQKIEYHKREQQELLKKIKLKAQELAKKKYSKLGSEEKKKYLKGYDMQLPFFKTTKENYIIEAIQTEMETNLKQEHSIYFIKEKED